MTTAEISTGSNIALGTWIGDLLSAIAPKNSPAFSANLHRWMRSHGRVGDTVYRLDAGGKLSRVYGAGTLFLGQPYADYRGDTDFSGVLLMGVLCNGSRATRVCLGGAAPSLVEVGNFWDQYKQIGRCAIDVTHSVGFRDEARRFHLVDGQRTCKWCAAPTMNTSK
ncbi:hypothetical protein C1X35_25820 [Pseudomonas sp. FW306-1C-G01A]|nr:hypothetical protein C1X51_29605 [Pseudomonas sp. FW306-2-2C-B10A]PMV86787.1 hypothetical protein C1X56_14160 [Pseudomonas sp. GW101-1A09]PMW00616.1 hypothetical protein C1X50_28185 [Pseudomonas sp. MPR-TSA4]PMW12569.1 hypothetical protein C1X52_19140 [Pseudomonas sp. FW306-2-1A-C05A]PMW29399.1 hypothetical protein C1X48_30150 [Pseudomonas sp. FW305-3-2-15-A-R2A1]PMW31414.1 hypothetical protein C1X49_27735 [Pseudomonas sp. MPR-E5]PMW47836.1 hypothetical protein C1X41_27535 [Pseudomonas sp.